MATEEQVRRERMNALDDAIAAYVKCALWVGLNDPGDEALESRPWHEDYGPDDIADDAVESIAREVREMFESKTGQRAIDSGLWTVEQFSHDFYLTRNGHGSGFWDRHYKNVDGERLGRELSELAHLYGEEEFYLGDDGKLYV